MNSQKIIQSYDHLYLFQLYKIHKANRSCWMRPECEDLALEFNMEHEIFNSNYKIDSYLRNVRAIPWKVDLAMIDDYRPYTIVISHL